MMKYFNSIKRETIHISTIRENKIRYNLEKIIKQL